MGTRSTIKFKETKQSEPVLCVYRQFDGYLEGAGRDYAEWLKDYKILNGFSEQSMDDKYANGVECLALQWVKHFKVSIGNFYATTSNDMQEYNYEVFMDNNILKMSCKYYDKYFEGTVEEFLDFCNNN